MRLAILAVVLALQPPAPFRVLKAEFGIVTPSGFQPATKVPLKEGQGFGWVIQLETPRERIRWREEIRLPAAPQTWQADETDGKHTLSADRRTSILERETRLQNGFIYSMWQISTGDPRGRYTMRVMVEDMLVATFEFDVE